MSFDWRPESKDRYFRKAEAAVKAAGFDDILQISKEQFAITKSTVKVYFKPIPREGKTRRWWEAKKSIAGMQEQSGGRDEFGRKKKTIFIHAVYVFVKMPSDKQLNKVREWLLYAVTKAEKELGGGTGQIKLRYVYDMFVARFTWLARVISFEAFSMMVDEALERMKKMLESNKAMQTLVSGEAGETVEKDM